MLNLEKLADVVSSQLGNLVIQASRCSRLRSRLSKCNACQDACPVGEFNWTEKELHINKCINCGICTVNCPTAALAWRFPSPKQLLAKIDEIEEVYQEATIYCSYHAPGKNIPSAMEVSCLNSIPWECWLRLLNFNKVNIYYPEDCCSACAAALRAENNLEQLEKAQRMAGQQIPRVFELKRPPKRRTSRPVNKERRQLFAALLGGVGRIPEKMVNGVLKEEKPLKRLFPNEGMLTERRQILLSVVERQLELAEKITLQLAAASGNCNFCGACSSLCPLGALRQKDCEDGEVFLELDTRLCTGCNLCVEICFHRGLELKPSTAAKWDDPVKVLFRGRSYTCPECGNPYLAEQEGKCPACLNEIKLAR